MLGLHNIFVIAPPPPQQNQQPPPPQPPQEQSFNQDFNLTDANLWTLKPVCENKDAAFNSVEVDDNGGSFKVCRDCGNRAKKECSYSRCRTCCKSRGYDCVTHVKSTWVPAATRRKERKEEVAVVDDRQDGSRGRGGGGGSSGSSSCCGSKRPRILSSASDGVTIHQDSRFKDSLPGKVRAPAAFKCIQVTAIDDGEAEVAYQATVNVSGHVFKGFLYDQGIDVKNGFPCISKMVFESSSSGRHRDSSSPVVNPPNTVVASD